jgi:hypothetical protein
MEDIIERNRSISPMPWFQDMVERIPIPTKTKLKLREYLSDKSELTENSLTSLLT